MKLKLDEQMEGELRNLPNEVNLNESARVLGSLSHPLRLKMALLLLKRDHCVCELVQLTRRKQNLVSHHLAVMRKRRTVESHMASGRKYYRLNDSAVDLLRGFEQVSVS